MENERRGYDNSLCKNHVVRLISGNDVISLKESNSTNTSISIKEGYLSCEFVGFEFRGNSRAAAYATVSYDGR